MVLLVDTDQAFVDKFAKRLRGAGLRVTSAIGPTGGLGAMLSAPVGLVVATHDAVLDIVRVHWPSVRTILLVETLHAMVVVESRSHRPLSRHMPDEFVTDVIVDEIRRAATIG